MKMTQTKTPQSTEALMFELTEARNHVLNRDKTEQEREEAKHHVLNIEAELNSRNVVIPMWKI